jgi:hypothetical protein
MFNVQLMRSYINNVQGIMEVFKTREVGEEE